MYVVVGYKEAGTITTAFDMRVQNGIDRFHLVNDVVASRRTSAPEAPTSSSSCATADRARAPH